MTKTILITLAALIGVAIGALLIIAAGKPDSFRIQRAASIKAPPETIFGFINDFRRWTVWSPWENKDPAMRRTYGASTSGVGATYAWEGDKNVGSGAMAITESAAPSKVALKLDFIKPFKAHNMVEFVLVPQDDGAQATQVTWTMHGPSNFMSKIMQTVMNMDRMVGRDFEAGLANLKSASEGAPRPTKA